MTSPTSVRAGEVKERPILFSAPMVRALLAGTKTVTRRIVKPQPHRTDERREDIGEVNGTPCTLTIPAGWEWRELFAADDGGKFAEAMALRSPYGHPGDRLWVRETHAIAEGEKQLVGYRADGQSGAMFDDGSGGRFLAHHGWITGAADNAREGKWFGLARHGGKWRPSIFMPRWASRIELEIVSVACERLHAITEAEAKAEGVEPTVYERKLYPSKYAATAMHESYRDAFELLWIAINGADSWAANPWVWRVEFAILTSRTAEGGE